MTEELPPLPEPEIAMLAISCEGWNDWDLKQLPKLAAEGEATRTAFTADQMRAYARQAGIGTEDMEVLREALSVLASISVSPHRRKFSDGCEMFMQTAEWCRWADDEVRPKLHAMVKRLAAAPQPDKA